MRLAASSTGSGSRLVLVHGFTQTGRSWRHIANQLAHDHEVVCVDAPGHGDSAAIRADLPTGAEALVSTSGRGAYIGYSMGGRLALQAALSAPAAVERLVLLGASPGIADPAERAARRASDERLAGDLERDGLDPFLSRWLANPMFARLPVDPDGLADRRRNTVEGLAASLRLAGTGSQAPLWDRLQELTMPILVLAGEHDHKFVEIGRQMAATIGPNATFHQIDGAGHAAHLEQPAAFLSLVEPFLDPGSGGRAMR